VWSGRQASFATGEPSPSGRNGGRAWWAHFEFTRINIEPTILRKKIEECPDMLASERFLARIDEGAVRQITAAVSWSRDNTQEI
jgi:hypothetical protein